MNTIITLLTVLGLSAVIVIGYRVYQQKNLDCAVRNLKGKGFHRIGGFLTDDNHYRCLYDMAWAEDSFIRAMSLDNRRNKMFAKCGENESMLMLAEECKIHKGYYRISFYAIKESKWIFTNRVGISSLVKAIVGDTPITYASLKTAC